MADYREVSQEYAQGAIKAAVILNSGAIVASISQMDTLSELAGVQYSAYAVILWLIGAVLGAFVWVAAFASTRHVDRTVCGQEPDYSKADTWMFAGVVVLLLSLAAFFLGGMTIALAFLCGLPA